MADFPFLLPVELIMSDDSSLGPPWTILKILRWTTDYFEDRDIESARVDAEVLLADLLGLERIELYAHFDRPLVDDELAAYRKRVKRRAQHEPCAYIVGHREFWSLDLQVDSRVLIPRPDTETLVRATLDVVDEEFDGRLVDVGTGSGAVAIAIAHERPHLQVAATDTDDDALEVAATNVENHDLDERISLFAGDLLEPLNDDWPPVDVVVSNPPYIAEYEYDQLQPTVRNHEPVDALLAGEDGLDVIRRLIPAAHRALKPGGHLLFEIGHRQGDAVRELLDEAGFEEIDIIPDYGDRDRVAVGRIATS